MESCRAGFSLTEGNRYSIIKAAYSIPILAGNGGIVLKKTMSAATVHSQYGEIVCAYRDLIADPTLQHRFACEIDEYVRRCALGLWKADNDRGITEHHVEFYNAIHAPESSSPDALYWEVATEVAGFDGFTPPDFFPRMIEYDRLMGSKLALRFVDQLTLMLLMLATVDGVVSEEEAGFINRCSDHLLSLCSGGETHSRIQAEEFVTCAPGTIKDNARNHTHPAEQTEKQSKSILPDLEKTLAELDSLCGLEQVKKEVKSLVNLVKVRRLREDNGLPVPPMSLHLVFMGNPGTGKTTVARLMAKIYHALGVLPKGQLVEVDRSGLVAGYVGQTALKTQQVIETALGGVLFIDEAYALVNQSNGNDFGQEAIEVLLKNMEDHRHELIVIAAGYTEQMERFIHSNPGLESRFNKYLIFEDYNGEQLLEIFRGMCQKNGYTLTKESEAEAGALFSILYENRDENFGNARNVRNLFEQTVACQSDRLARMESPSREDLMQLLPDDLRQIIETKPDQPGK